MFPKLFWGTGVPGSQNIQYFEELGELFPVPNFFWGTLRNLFPKLRDSKYPLRIINFIYLIIVNVYLDVLHKSMANIKE